MCSSRGTAPGRGIDDFPRWGAERPRTAETRLVAGGRISPPAPHGSHRGEGHGRPQAAPAPSGFVQRATPPWVSPRTTPAASLPRRQREVKRKLRPLVRNANGRELLEGE